MHGRKRAAPGSEPTAEQAAKVAHKVTQYKKLSAVALKHVSLGRRRPSRVAFDAWRTRALVWPATRVGRALLLQKVECVVTPEAYKLNGDVCALSPDTQSLWNYRRTLVLAIEERIRAAEAAPPAEAPAAAAAAVGSDGGGTSGSSAPAAGAAAAASAAAAGAGSGGGVSFPSTLSALASVELKVTQDAITKNPKSYSAWHHRQWTIAHFPPPLVSIDHEIGLCNLMLEGDERNFHCWNYRRWVVAFGRVPADAELAYTLERIKRNFSNYSAWHYRSALLVVVHGAAPDAAGDAAAGPAVGAAAAAAGGSSSISGAGAPSSTTFTASASTSSVLPVAVLRAEADLVRQAVYTEPDDQSAWFYHRWVTDRCAGALAAACAAPTDGSVASSDAVALLGLLLEDVAAIQELHDAEPTSKCKSDGVVCKRTLERMSPARVPVAMRVLPLPPPPAFLQGRCWRWRTRMRPSRAVLLP